MEFRPNVVERAFQLAMSGRYRTVTEILIVLRSERYDAIGATFSGAGIRNQLKVLMRQSAASASRVSHASVSAHA